MFSGKSEELIRRLRRAQASGRSVQAFKPSIDDRYSVDTIATHGNGRMQAEAVERASDISLRVEARSEVIGIDEANFFGADLAEVAVKLTKAGHRVMVAGLDLDYLGQPFPPMPSILALAESITKLLAICACCGAPALHSQRLVNSEELILVGGVDWYEARCRQCFEPGVPHLDASRSCAGQRES